MSWKRIEGGHTHSEDWEPAGGVCVVLACNGCGLEAEIDAGVVGHWEPDDMDMAVSMVVDGSDTDEPWYVPDGETAYCYRCRETCEHDHAYDDDGRCEVCFAASGAGGVA